uniref:NPL4 homolog, ubiquitin recognition factor n=1 Tax=Scleropages formosus TaxID=113540 RepID=A0A8C9REA0_SCLFO
VSHNKTLSLLKIVCALPVDMPYLFPSGEVMASPCSSSLVPSTLSSSSFLLKSHSVTQIQEDDTINTCLSRMTRFIGVVAQWCSGWFPCFCVCNPFVVVHACCVPQPFHKDYLNHLDPPIKHMLFHPYIPKLTGGADKGMFVALENISCKIRSDSEGHPPWPEGICTKCQPSAVTLSGQVRCHNHTIADHFLDFWRKTGNQHVGFLYGRYTEHEDILLGIQAEVAAIYDPCCLSSVGHFGSKFVTLVATGSPDNQVHFEGYQVFNRCSALVRDECLLPCQDAPKLSYAKESTTEQYVPDEDKDITFLAWALRITTTFPKDPVFTFASTCPFSIDNQDTLDDTGFPQFSTVPLQKSLLDVVFDFHLLIFLFTNEVMPPRDNIGLLLDDVRTSDEDLAQTWRRSDQWATTEQLWGKSGRVDYRTMGDTFIPVSSTVVWSCPHWTFMNQPDIELCEMCSLPHN